MKFLKTGRLVRNYRNLTEVEGFLMLPRQSSSYKEKFPIVVLCHDSGGINDFSLHFIALLLANRNIATFIPYHYFSRNIYTTGGDQINKISVESQLDDIFRGLDVISNCFPCVDTERTILCGFSRGGTVVDLMSRVEYNTAFVSPKVKIKGIACFFPEIVSQQRKLNLTGVPLLYLCGSLDDYTPAEGIRRYVNRILSENPKYDVRYIFFEGGRHCFFAPTLEDLEQKRAPQIKVITPQVLSNCNFAYDTEGFFPFANLDTARPTPWRDFGVFIQGNARKQDAYLAANVEISKNAIITFLDFVSLKI